MPGTACQVATSAADAVGIRLVAEAMDAVDLGLTWRERVILIVLAETARDDTRLCWPGYEGDDERAATFRRRVDCSRTQFYATLSALVSKGALETEKHGHKGQQAVYRVLPKRPARVIHSVPETGTLSTPEASRFPGPFNGSKGPGFECKGSRKPGPLLLSLLSTPQISLSRPTTDLRPERRERSTTMTRNSTRPSSN